MTDLQKDIDALTEDEIQNAPQERIFEIADLFDIEHLEYEWTKEEWRSESKLEELIEQIFEKFWAHQEEKQKQNNQQ